MILWEREKQCKECKHEGGCNIVVGTEKDGSLIYEYEFSCLEGNETNCDRECYDFSKLN
jgi:hypothetical protein